jgi:hypothetical protein
MKVMYDRVQAAGQPVPAPPVEVPAESSAQGSTSSARAATAPSGALQQLSALVLSNSALSSAEKAELLLELANQLAAPTVAPVAVSSLRVADEPTG